MIVYEAYTVANTHTHAPPHMHYVVASLIVYEAYTVALSPAESVESNQNFRIVYLQTKTAR